MPPHRTTSAYALTIRQTGRSRGGLLSRGAARATAQERRMHHKGGCHCGQVTIEVEGELTTAVSCNCSICSRKGALLWAVPRGKLRLLGSEDALGTYLFNKHAMA